MTQNYVLNCWYVVATSDEVGYAPERRSLLDDAVVLYRSEAGAVVALRDRCVHCGFPLSKGTTREGRIVCAYHGLVFDESGACVRVPSQSTVPTGIRVRNFPTHDDGTFVWIWPGNPAAAELTPPPRLPWLDDPSWTSFGESTVVEAGYLLLHEHLLDITHYWVGLPESSPADLASLPPIDTVELTETTVGYHRAQPPAALVEWEASSTGLDPNRVYSHRDSVTFLSPGVDLMTWDIDGGDGTTFRHGFVRAFTPETSGRTRVYWLTAYDYADRQPLAIHTLRSATADTVAQDTAMVEAVQANIDPETIPTGVGRAAGTVSIVADTAALKAGQIIREMIAREAGRRP